jgi:F420-dependent oxidoreductase-like protein
MLPLQPWNGCNTRLATGSAPTTPVDPALPTRRDVMRVAIHVVRFDWPDQPESIAPTLAEVATVSEEAGIAALSVMDHWFQLDYIGAVTEPMMECYTTLAYLAAHTSTLQLRALVTGVTYRQPGVLAKMVSTLDVLTGGRVQLGLGAAWYEREHLGLGVDYPPLAERFERLEEALQICLQMWSDDDGPFRGKHYQLAETICSPRPIATPHPPILIGGNGEQKTLRLVARYGDACNVMVSTPADAARKFDVLLEHCRREGRDPSSISRTITYVGDPFADVDGFVACCEEFAALGADEVVLMARQNPVADVRRVADEILPRLT